MINIYTAKEDMLLSKWYTNSAWLWWVAMWVCRNGCDWLGSNIHLMSVARLVLSYETNL
jgi:hypothetical protein